MNLVSRIPIELARERAGWQPHAALPPPKRELPPPEQAVQGVVVQPPPREAKLSVRVEIVTDAERRDEGARQSAEALADSFAEASARSAKWFANVADLPPSAAGRLGAPDLQHAASAYRAHADWQPYASASPEPARRLSVRA